MGVICHGHDPNKENEITRINNPIFFDKNYIDKVILIQKNFKAYNSKKKNLLLIKDQRQEKLYKELSSKKLINFNKILETKSYQFYSSLDKKILPKPFKAPSSKIPSVILSVFFSGLNSKI